MSINIIKYGFTAVFVIALLGGSFYFYQKANEKQTKNIIIEQQEVIKVDGKKRTTLDELLAKGRQAECTFRHEADGSIISGKVYVDGKRLRSDFTSTGGELGDVEGSIIKDRKFLYSWAGPTSKTGIKVRLAEATEDIVDNFISTDDIIDFNCSYWFIKERVFIPTADISFLDLSSDEILTEKTELEIKSADCSICNAITYAPSKAECREEFECI